jgi:hypothetical protein
VIIGDPSVFAIESGITSAYERLSFRALGFFVIHVGDRRYGVYAPQSTMLACSFDEVERRIADRGGHTAPFSAEFDAGKIAHAFRNAMYSGEPDKIFFGIPLPEFRELLFSNHLVWAPDGDQAFDDGSYVLQFDVKERVRLIAFKMSEDYLHDRNARSDVWLKADTFYDVLERWHNAFESEWAAAPKLRD